MLAARNGHTDIVSALLKHGVDFSAVRRDGFTALMLAARSGHTGSVLALLDGGASVDEARPDGSTALMFAAQNGHTRSVSTFLKRGVNFNAVRRDGFTALMLAAQNGHTRSVLALLERGADVNAVRRDGTTALMFAALKGHTEIVSALLARSDINLKILDDQLNHPGLRNLNKEVSELLAGALTDGEKRNSFIERFNQRNPNDRIQIIQPLQQAPNSLAESQSQTSPAVTISNPNLIAKVTPKQNEGRCTVS
jgi:ankyrin repeat protein